MNIWQYLKPKNDKTFEVLALKYVEKVYPSERNWTPTKETRDGNRDAQVVFFIEDGQFIRWWMEAKYTSKEKLSRYRLDATIVTSILQKNVKKYFFVTNSNISTENIINIKTAITEISPKAVVHFITKTNLESWLKRNPKYIKEFFSSNISEKDIDISEIETTSTRFVEVTTINSYAIRNPNFSVDYLSYNTRYRLSFSFFSYNDDIIEILPNNIGKYPWRIVGTSSLKEIPVNSGENHIQIEFQIVPDDRYDASPNGSQNNSFIYEKNQDSYSIYHFFDLCKKSNSTKISILSPKHFTLIKNTVMKPIYIKSQENVRQRLEENCKTTRNHTKTTQIFSIISPYKYGKSYLVKNYFSSPTIQQFPKIFISFSSDDVCNLENLVQLVHFILFPLLHDLVIKEDYPTPLSSSLKSFIQQYQAKNYEALFRYFQSDILTDFFQQFKETQFFKLVIVENFQFLSNEYKEFFEHIIQACYNEDYNIFFVVTSTNPLTFPKDVIHISEVLSLDGINPIYEPLKESIKNIKQLQDLNTFPILKLEPAKLLIHFSSNENIKSFEDLSKEELEVVKSVFLNYSLPPNDIQIYSEATISLLEKNFLGFDINQQLVPFSSNLLEEFLNWIIDNGNELFISENINFNHPLQEIFVSLFIDKNREKSQEAIATLQQYFSHQEYHSIYYLLRKFKGGDNYMRLFYRFQNDYYLLHYFFAMANANVGQDSSGSAEFLKLFNILDEKLKYNSESEIFLNIILNVVYEIINSDYENYRLEQFRKHSKKFHNLLSYHNVNHDQVQTIKSNQKFLEALIKTENTLALDCKLLEEFMNYSKIDEYGKIYTQRLARIFYSSNITLAKEILFQIEPISIDKYNYFLEIEKLFIKFLENPKQEQFLIILQKVSILKKDYLNDYKKYILGLVAGAIILDDQTTLKNLIKEIYDSGKRPYRARQQLFFANIFNYLELVQNNQYLEIENKLRLIDSSPLPNHYKNINLHNLKLSCSPAHVEFYLGGELKDNTFYFDPRSIW